MTIFDLVNRRWPLRGKRQRLSYMVDGCHWFLVRGYLVGLLLLALSAIWYLGWLVLLGAFAIIAATFVGAFGIHVRYFRDRIQ